MNSGTVAVLGLPLIAFGNPKQEVRSTRNRNELRVSVLVGIGGTFEFLAGSVQQTSGWDMAALTGATGKRDCLLNLAHLSFGDSSGFIFFFKIQKHLVYCGNQCVLCSFKDNVNQPFWLTKRNLLFRVVADLAAARRIVEETVCRR